MRIHELGKELNVDNKAIVEFLRKEGVNAKSQLSAVPEKMIEKVRLHFGASAKTEAKKPSEVRAVAVPDFIVKKAEAKDKPDAEPKKEGAESLSTKAPKQGDQEAGQPVKKKIVAVFNPENSETSQGRAAAKQRAQQQERSEKKKSQGTTKRIPARDRRPDDDQPIRPRKLPSQIRPARDRKPDDEIAEEKARAEAALREKQAAEEAAKLAAKKAEEAARLAAKKSEEAAQNQADDNVKAAAEDNAEGKVKTTAENQAAYEVKTTVDSSKPDMVKAAEEEQISSGEIKPAEPSRTGADAKSVKDQKPASEQKAGHENVHGKDGKPSAKDKSDVKKDSRSGESEAAKSLRDKIVKGTVNITDIPVKTSRNDRKQDNKKQRDDNRGRTGDSRPDRQKQQGGGNHQSGGTHQSGAAPQSNDRRDGGRGKGKFNKYDKSKGDKFDRLENEKAAQKQVKQQTKPVPVEEEIKVITLPETISIKDFAAKLKMQPAALIKNLFLKGKVYTVNDILDFETAEEIALEFDIISEHEVVIDYIEELLKEDEEDEDKLIKRPPVVCVMGHVDHGKTSLLDAIRKTNVIEGEAGGITQHIGAYTVEINGESITFLDTPGHEAFTAMRLRGAQATDVAILVVAADDGVMPQTVEAINHAKAANIHVIVAVNKIDKPGANVNKVMQELSDLGLVPEDWGGDTIFVPISAKTGEGIENLLEMVILGTEILELKANPNRMARGIVIEAKLDKGRGSVSTLLVQKGTLKVGDHIAMGEAYGKVRAMTDDKGHRLKEAGPSTPVEITGLSGVPNAGEVFVAYDNDKDAKHFAQVFIEENKKKLLAGTKAKMNLDDVFDQMKAGELKELDIVIKADVQGSAEAMKDSLEKISNDEVIVKVIHAGVGNVSESDAVLASASNAIIIAFNVGVNADARMTIEHEKVDLRSYKVIYNAIDDVEAAMKGMLEPIYEEVVTGHVEVRQTFKASGVGVIAGSYVTDGIVKRDSKIRLYRDDEVIYDGQVASLKRFNDDAKEVRSGYECGIVLADHTDIKEGDTMEAYEMKEVPRQ